MPRPKVKDQDRQRASNACIPCKHSKIRCDAKLPCGTCKRKGRVSVCQYLNPTAVRHSSTSSVAQQTPLARQRSQSDQGTAVTDQAGRSHASASDVLCRESWRPGYLPEQSLPHLPGIETMENTERNRANSSITSSRASSTESPEATRSRLLLNAKGERVYIGEIASLSFLQFLRGTLRYHMGSSAFTEANTKDVMLEVEMTDNRLGTIPELSDADEAELTQCYVEATSGIFDLDHRHEPSTQLDQNTIHNHNVENLIILAIGAQCRGRPSDIQFGSNCFKKARSVAFEDMLSDPSVSMIKVFLLMSFYMLGASRRNAAFMYLGVSARAACALGLHTKDYYRNVPYHIAEARQALWKSLFILDTIVSSVLGRPSSLPAQELEDAASVARPETSPIEYCKAALEASYGASIYLSSLIQQSPSKTTASIDSTELLLGRLKSWSQSLHHSLRQLASSTGDRKLPIGNTHLGCIYYFTVMLSTRPFLILHNIGQLQKAKQPALNGTRPFLDYERVSKLAQVCLDAAVTLANLTHRVQAQSGFLNNMCLVKAFVFAAGILIGFSLFSSDSTDLDAQKAYSNAQTVLQQFSLLDPLAKHYHEILNDFSDAIEEYHRQKLNKKRRATNQYLGHIFDMGSNTQPQNISVETGQQQYLTPGSGDETIPRTSVGDAFMTADDIDFYSDLDFNAMMEIYDPSNLPLVWDDFGLA